MGDHFVLLVDRLLTESTLEATIESGNRVLIGQANEIPLHSEADEDVPQKRDYSDGSVGGKLVECRYCQDEDQDCNLETPCSCCGSLKYAHRKCVQRWCNEKGDTSCEICLQQFKPGYTAPPQLFHYGGVPMNFRGNWGISRQDVNNPHLLAMVSTNHSYLDHNYDDYESSSARNVLYCRTVAVIFMALLILRHALPIILSGDEYTFTVFALLLLRLAGILLPVYVMVQALYVFRRRRRPLQESHELPVATSESEDEQTHRPSPRLQPQHI